MLLPECCLPQSLRQPPCEAVSWNCPGLPPTEGLLLSASLWGCELKCIKFFVLFWLTNVSLLVRLWVEILFRRCSLQKEWVSLLVRLWVEMYLWCDTLLNLRQPPCEAVSWNNDLTQILHFCRVSLLVRLWVEIVSVAVAEFLDNVSLLVRLWVEMAWFNVQMILCV